MRRHSIPFVLAALLALSACSTPQPPSEPEPVYPVSGKVINVGDLPVPTVISLVATNPSTYGFATGLSPLSRDYEGKWLALDSDVLDADGNFEWDLGDGSDIPAAYLAPAGQAFQSLFGDVTCTTTASKPVQVLRVWMTSGAMVPTASLGPLTASGTYSDGLVVYTDAPSIDTVPSEPFKMGSFTFAADDVTVQGSCVLDDGVNPAKTVIDIDVELVSGWNQIVMEVDPTEEFATVTDGTFEGAWLGMAYDTAP